MMRFLDLPSDGYDPPTYDIDDPREQTDPPEQTDPGTDYERGFRDAIRLTLHQFERLAAHQTSCGENYRAGITLQFVHALRHIAKEEGIVE